MFIRKSKSLALVALFINAQAASLLAQFADSAPPAAAPSAPPISAEELDQIVAPIALYPDSLLSQIFMASTYPLEVVQADRFAKANPSLTGDALTTQLESQPWDPSVKSLVNFPTVLAMMSEHLDSTIKLGDAFLADQKSVMDAVQRLRAKAQAAGNLQTTPQQTIIVEQAPQTNVQVIRIEPAAPQVIYVPTYNPVVVYGPWPYPTYPPYYYRPPGYVATGAVIGFGVGFACGAAWGYAWGNCNWGRSNVNVNINRNTNINTNINRSKYQNNINNNGNWQHNPSHRQGVPYSSNTTAQRYGNAPSNQAVQSREAYRGRADAGRQDLNNGAANQYHGQNAASPSNRPNAGQTGIQNQNRPASGQTANPAQNRPSTGQVNPGQNRPNTTPTGSAAQNRPANNTGSSATLGPANTNFGGVDGGGNATRNASQRGSSSRTSSPGTSGTSRGTSGSSGASRSAGGGGGSGGGGGGARR